MQEMNTVVWRDHKIVGRCSMTQELRDKLNGTQMSFYFSKATNEEKTNSCEVKS